jgi:HSP20 family protein
MDRDVARSWMWSEACEMVARAERLHREFFRPIHSASRLAAWEPPVDILETEHEVLVFVALPGVSADCVEVAIEESELVSRAFARFPRNCRPQSFIASNFPRAASSAECVFRREHTAASAIRPSTVAF